MRRNAGAILGVAMGAAICSAVIGARQAHPHAPTAIAAAAYALAVKSWERADPTLPALAEIRKKLASWREP